MLKLDPDPLEGEGPADWDRLGERLLGPVLVRELCGLIEIRLADDAEATVELSVEMVELRDRLVAVFVLA